MAIVVAAVVVVVIVVVVVVLLLRSRKSEGFDGKSAVLEVATPATTVAPVAPQDSKVGVTVGSLVDGPGSENGPSPVLSRIYSDIPDSYYFLDDGANGEMSVQNNLCSKSCCSAQWPTPFKQKSDPYVCDGLKNGKYVPSRMMCSNTFQDAGCLCLTKDQGQFLYNRGRNGSEWF
ncbi:hypothetical protein Indivirus_4_35 [Indivirus ILV1]|uniref:Uncharacterized protein n=1 Tax=Indivirus ILV1 TaxID=1977633 RepID=A0A1V0SDS0_9VIRU|nr:hypothetical protein Indivirus_4_35 [Indivirus ILV1]